MDLGIQEKKAILNIVKNQENLSIIEGSVENLHIEKNKIKG